MPTLSQAPQCCTSIEDVKTLLNFVHSCHLCCGNSDEKFIVYISTKNGKIMNASGKYSSGKKYGAMIPLFYYENRQVMSVWLTWTPYTLRFAMLSVRF